MFAVKLTASGYVEEFTLATLRQFADDQRYQPLPGTDTSPWVFVDRIQFWSDDEITYFYLNYAVFYYDASHRILQRDYRLS